MISECFPMTIGTDEVQCERELHSSVEDSNMMHSKESVRYIVIHCTGTRSNVDYDVRQLLRDHKARKFRTIGYHYYIRRNGEVTQHRKLLEVGAHCRPFNRCSIGVCYEGGLDEQGHYADTRTREQKDQLLLLLMRLMKLFPQAHIVGHRDLPGTTPKACPCFDASEYGYIERFYR